MEGDPPIPASALASQSAISPTGAGRLRAFLSLTKGRQTMLLYATGICAYFISAQQQAHPWSALWLSVALLASISGCTVWNMIIDRDIDALMPRTASRPLVNGRIRVREAVLFATILSTLGIGLAFWLHWLVGLIIAAGFLFDLVIYSIWLKRRTALSIIFGGISGGMPALAGRALAIGAIDIIGILFALSILLWIPAHMVTLTIKYGREYREARVPVWANVYGERQARRFIAIANVLNAAVLIICGLLLEIVWPALALLGISAAGMIGLAIWGICRPSERATWVLFKTASIYMLLSFTLITLGAMLR